MNRFSILTLNLGVMMILQKKKTAFILCAYAHDSLLNGMLQAHTCDTRTRKRTYSCQGNPGRGSRSVQIPMLREAYCPHQRQLHPRWAPRPAPLSCVDRRQPRTRVLKGAKSAPRLKKQPTKASRPLREALIPKMTFKNCKTKFEKT
jgi:hypothetical protein